MSKYLFRAKTSEAFTIKSLSEVLQNILTDVCFSFDLEGEKDGGIRLLTVDNKVPSRILVHLKLFGKNFDEYHCPKTLTVGINLQHLHKMLKSVKKKDTIELAILKASPTMLSIISTHGDTGQPVMSEIKIQKLAEVSISIPFKYSHPIHIPTNAFQKMCKDMQNISSDIQIYSKGNFLKCSCKEEGMYKREFPFGTLDENSETEDYDEIFHTKLLNQLIKFSGLNARMQFYIPPPAEASNEPLRISINTGQLGELCIYIKTKDQILAEEAT